MGKPTETCGIIGRGQSISGAAVAAEAPRSIDALVSAPAVGDPALVPAAPVDRLILPLAAIIAAVAHEPGRDAQTASAIKQAIGTVARRPFIGCSAGAVGFVGCAVLALGHSAALQVARDALAARAGELIRTAGRGRTVALVR